MLTKKVLSGLLLVFLLGLLSACGRGADSYPQLPSLELDADRFYVAGLSSGGYMAQQLQMAWPEEVQGAAIFAAGPYGCARRGVNAALLQCMAVTRGRPNTSRLLEQLRETSEAGQVGDLQQLQQHRVFIYQAEADPVIHAAVSQAVVEFYQQLVPGEQLLVTQGRRAGHGFPTLDKGVACQRTASPFVNACGFSGAAQSLDHLDGQRTHSLRDQPQGELQKFSQKPFSEASRGMADFGYLYRPPECQEEAQCGLKMVLHGCEQAAEKVGQSFIEKSGYLQEADARQLVMVFPQIDSSLTNPKGCWDWWGYESSAFDTREGPQVEALRGIWKTLLSGYSAESP
ncbi:Esterase PHB depolymerase [Marinospirillum celere]|uniref:Esterase PHB depolymerase n=2 Tax=Marinospirillum celere TaxID=1122252 RepID=A0A1I1HQL9_9GAMM|nr:Esterase PHB depolymerase [Marinospirillum celere]